MLRHGGQHARKQARNGVLGRSSISIWLIHCGGPIRWNEICGEK
jgi:hypothetical protein